MAATETLYLRLPEDLKRWLKEQSAREDTTMQQLIINTLKQLQAKSHKKKSL